jgi:hypothetical protein
MIKPGTTIKDKRGYYIVDDIDTIDRFVIIRKVMEDRKGNIYYGRKRVIGLDQLSEYAIV